MQQSLRRLLTGAIDYAGLFPPASLTLPEAVDEYVRWREHLFGFAVSRFCCPVGRLAELQQAIEQPRNRAIQISTIGAVTTNREEWENARQREAANLNEFLSDEAEIVAYEVRIPDHAALDRHLQDLRGFSSVDVFAELPWEPEMSESVAAVAEAEWCGVKARCGPAVPSEDDLAGLIWNCISLEVPFKLTAGLHQAIRSDQGHGFINVITACHLAYAQDFSPSGIAEVLSCQEPTAWQFDEDTFSWRGNRVSMEQIDENDLFTGFGSCSIEEPWQDLKALDWI